MSGGAPSALEGCSEIGGFLLASREGPPALFRAGADVNDGVVFACGTVRLLSSVEGGDRGIEYGVGVAFMGERAESVRRGLYLGFGRGGELEG